MMLFLLSLARSLASLSLHFKMEKNRHLNERYKMKINNQQKQPDTNRRHMHTSSFSYSHACKYALCSESLIGAGKVVPWHCKIAVTLHLATHSRKMLSNRHIVHCRILPIATIAGGSILLVHLAISFRPSHLR